jgi:hypothetical protein
MRQIFGDLFLNVNFGSTASAMPRRGHNGKQKTTLTLRPTGLSLGDEFGDELPATRHQT